MGPIAHRRAGRKGGVMDMCFLSNISKEVDGRRPVKRFLGINWSSGNIYQTPQSKRFRTENFGGGNI